MRNWPEKHQQEDTNFSPPLVDCIDDILMNQPYFKKGKKKKKDHKKNTKKILSRRKFSCRNKNFFKRNNDYFLIAIIDVLIK